MRCDVRKRLSEIVGIAKDGDQTSAAYDIVMTVLIVLSIVPMCFKTHNATFVWIENICVVAFVVDYLLRLITADFQFPGKGAVSFLRYPFTPFAIIDLLAILPSLTALNSGFRMLKILRLFRSLRVLKVLRYSKSFTIIAGVLKKQKSSLLAVLVLALGYIFVTALVMFTVEPGGFDTFFDALY